MTAHSAATANDHKRNPHAHAAVRSTTPQQSQLQQQQQQRRQLLHMSELLRTLTGRKRVVVTPEDAIQQLQARIVANSERIDSLTSEVTRLRAVAVKRNKEGKRRDAIGALQRAHMLDDQITLLHNNTGTLETQVFALHSAAGNAEVLAAIQQGIAAYKSSSAETSLDKVDDVMLDAGEQVEESDRVSKALSGRSSLDDAADAELEAELDVLLEQMHGPTQYEAVSLPALPNGQQPPPLFVPVAPPEITDDTAPSESQETSQGTKEAAAS